MRIEYRCKRNDNSLQHWGILGMKWGNRRYQNADGSLTEAGRERYGVGKALDDRDRMSLEGKKQYGKDIASDLALNAGTAGEGGMKLFQDIKNARKKPEQFPDYSRISDEDLKKIVSRMNMEQQYKDLSEKRIAKGHDRLREGFDIAGDIAGLGVTVAFLLSHIIPLVRASKDKTNAKITNEALKAAAKAAGV